MHAYAVRWRGALGAAWAKPLAMAAFALLTALAAFVRIPLPGTPVPLTLQVFIVLLGGALLGRAYGAGAQLLYLGLGFAGLPFFAQCSAGLALFGCPTAGYVAAFPVAAWLVGWLGQGRGARGLFTVMLGAVGAIYALGALHLALALHVDVGVAVLLGVLPFVAGDAAKAGVASALAARARGS
jgi:biotin transport system substrate-specific component